MFNLHGGITDRKSVSTLPNQRSVEIVDHWECHGTIHPVKKGKSGHPRTVRVYALRKIEEIRQPIERSPGTSLRIRSQELLMSKQMTWFILRPNLQLYPYKITERTANHVICLEIRSSCHRMCCAVMSLDCALSIDKSPQFSVVRRLLQSLDDPIFA